MTTLEKLRAMAEALVFSQEQRQFFCQAADELEALTEKHNDEKVIVDRFFQSERSIFVSFLASRLFGRFVFNFR